jgi:cysteine desulfurase family protein (TIGR01976 family)
MESPSLIQSTLDINHIRSQFPGLSDDFILMDNAGGSQACIQVINRIKEYFLNYNVQLGATYRHSASAGEQMELVHSELAKMMNTNSPSEVISGPSTTALLRILSICLSRKWKKGDEVIVTNSDHEANVSCWTDLKEQGINIKIWKVNPETMTFDLDDLRNMMTDKTRLVAMVHASNLLGTINPIKEVAKLVHDAGAYICVDGVAYAPHRIIDVKEWNVDFYVFSTYKTYGPHQALMYGRKEILNAIKGLNHYFIDSIPYKFQPGNFNFELTYSMLGIKFYLESLTGSPKSTVDSTGRTLLHEAFRQIAVHEEKLAHHLLQFLNSIPKVRIIGSTSWNKDIRVPTISFVHDNLKSSEVVNHTDKHNIGIRYGDFYAKKLVHDLGLEEKDGVVRISMVHYNTVKEVEKVIDVLGQIL